MKVKMRHKLIAALLVSMAIVVMLGVLSFYFVRDVVAASRFATHSQQVLFFLERTKRLSLEVRLAYSQSPADSVSQASSVTRIRRMYHTVDSLVSDNEEQRLRAKRLQTTLTLFEASKEISLLDELGAINDEMQEVEVNLKRERQAATTSQFYNFIKVSLTLLVVWIANILVVLLILNKNLKERDKAEQRLSLAYANNNRLYEEAPCGYFTLSGDGIIVKVNRTLLRWLGRTNDTITDRVHILDLVSKEDRAEVTRSLFDQNLESGELIVSLQRGHASELPVLVNFRRSVDKAGHLVYLCSVVDNTERRKAELEAKYAYKELESFSYSVSHDLRAPLRSINGYGQILLDDYGSSLDDEGRRVIEVIINNGKRMGMLIDDLLDFSRTSRKELSSANIEMNEFVKSIVSELMEREGGRTIDLQLNWLNPMHGDPSMLRQVWVNLVSNALKYSRKKDRTTIEIGCETKNDELIYYIRDNGAGFSMDYYGKLFGVFQRLHRVQDFEGTGVGLALVKRIIERHGGRIWAESKLDEGATFYFSIPVRIDAQAEKAL